MRYLTVLLLASSLARGGDARDETERLLGKGQADLVVRSDPRAAEEAFQRALAGARRLADDRLLSRALCGLSGTALWRGEKEKGLDLARQARQAARSARAPDLEVAATQQEGNALYVAGDFRRALEAFEDARRMLGPEGDRYARALAAKDVGILHRLLGELDESLDAIQEAVGLLRPEDPPVVLASALENLGVTLATLGDDERAREAFERALEIFRRERNQEGIYSTLLRIGRAEANGGRLEKALTKLQAALSIADRQKIERWSGGALQEIGDVLSELGRRDEALAAHERAREIHLRLRDELSLANDLRNLAYLRLEGGDAPGAERLFREAIGIRERREARGDTHTLTGLAAALRAQGDLSGAREWGEKAVADLEATRARLLTPERRAGFLSGSQYAYHGLIETLLAGEGSARDPEAEVRAFELLERGRARATAEAIAEARLDPSAEPGQDAGARQHPHPLSGRQARSLLDAKSGLVAYSLHRRRAFAFVVTADRVRAVRLATSPAELAERVESYVGLLGQTGGERWRKLGERLHAELVTPVSTLLPAGLERLIVVPDGALASLPFEALPVPEAPGRSLGDDLAVSYVPSATVLAELRRPRRGPAPERADLAVLAEPFLRAGLLRRVGRNAGGGDTPSLDRLPFAAAEARAVRAHGARGSVLFVGAEASEGLVKSGALARFRVLHVAAHGLLDERSPSRSALLLAAGADGDEDGLLRAREIYGLRLPHDLVVLSACRSARGRVLPGEGAQGLARAFFHAGARCVVASLWGVRDRATARLMDRLYAHLASGRSVAQALRRARLDLRGAPGEATRAAFVVLGDGDVTVPLTPRRSGRAWRIAGAGAALALILGLAARRRQGRIRNG